MVFWLALRLAMVSALSSHLAMKASTAARRHRAVRRACGAGTRRPRRGSARHRPRTGRSVPSPAPGRWPWRPRPNRPRRAVRTARGPSPARVAGSRRRPAARRARRGRLPYWARPCRSRCGSRSGSAGRWPWPGDGGVHRVGVMAVDGADHVPAIGLEALRRVVGESSARRRRRSRCRCRPTARSACSASEYPPASKPRG